ncbi:MAG: MFS transporter [Thermoplasmata archaeon]
MWSLGTRKKIDKPEGMTAFLVVWAGQLVSILGSIMTNFALMIWIWMKTGEATPFAIFGFVTFTPLLLATPLAGVLVDRWDRKLTMILSDLAAGIATIMIFILFLVGGLELWHLYILGAFSGFFGAFQFPAFSASISLMVKKENYARANGLLSMAGTTSGLFGPVLAAAFLGIIGIKGILIIDIVTFTAAIGTLLFIQVPQPKKSEVGDKSVSNIWNEMLFGFKYIYKRRSLMGLLLVFLAINVFFQIGNTLRAPMMLARTGGSEYVLAGVQSIACVGGILGGLVLAVWGGPKNKIRGIFLGMGASSIFGVFLMGLGTGLIIWGVGSFVMLFSMSITGGCSQSFWQSKVEPDIQGKVFSARRFIAQASIPIASLISGPMADGYFEPAMSEGGSLSLVFGNLVGTGSGAGMAVIYLIIGIFGLLVVVVGYSVYHIREAENILSDFDPSAQGVTA